MADGAQIGILDFDSLTSARSGLTTKSKVYQRFGPRQNFKY